MASIYNSISIMILIIGMLWHSFWIDKLEKRNKELEREIRIANQMSRESVIETHKIFVTEMDKLIDSLDTLDRRKVDARFSNDNQGFNS